MGRVLVMGGTGAIGFYLVPELVRHGHEVFVTTRSERKSDISNIHYIRGNAREPAFIENVLVRSKYDAIINFMGYSTHEFESIYKLLLSKTGHYLFLSSYRVFADNGKTPITEESPRLLDVCKDEEYLRTDEYALHKARQENILRKSGLRHWTILRPGITYSRYRFQLGTLEANTICFRALQGIPIAMAHDILSRITTMTWAGDVAKLIAKLTLNSRAFGEDYNVVTSEYHTWEEVANIYKDYIGLKIEIVDLEKYLYIVQNKYPVIYDRLFDRRLDNSKVLQATGIKQSEFTSLRDGLGGELSRFKQAPYFQYPHASINARMDRVLGTKISLRGLSLRDKLKYYVEYNLLGGWLSNAYRKLRTFC